MILKDVIKLDERFQTSVNIRFDIDKISKIDEFIPAKSTLNVLESYLESIFEKKNNKSTLLVGPYGKGKSHLLLVLLALLQNRNDKKWENAITRFYEKIKKQNKRLAACIEKNILCGRPYRSLLPDRVPSDPQLTFPPSLSHSLSRCRSSRSQ